MHRLRHKLSLILLVLAAFFVMGIVVIEMRVKPIVTEFASSRARQFSTEMINTAVTALLDDDTPLVVVSNTASGVAGAEVNTRAIASLRTAAVDAVSARLDASPTLRLHVPLFNLTGSTLASGIGLPVNVRLLPVGDILADVRSEFIESGINQTLHKIVLRIRLTLNLLVANETITTDITNDIVLAETVIVGDVPEAYTAINRFEIDDQEENDLNDYAASIP